MMLIRWPGLRVGRYLKSRGVDVIRVFQTRSFSRSVHAKRYAITSIISKARTGHYDQVMMADVRDVVFQRNPFAGIEPEVPFLSGGSAHHRRGRHQSALGARLLPGGGGRRARSPSHQLQRHHHRRHDGNHRHLEHMVAKISAMPLRIYRTIGHGYDQAIHNYLRLPRP
jgi:hypothetical protein